VRKSFELPWASFKLILNILRKNQIQSSEEARKICLAKSGLGQLENFLRERIFSKTAIIKHFQCLKRTQSILQPLILKIQADLAKQQQDARRALQAADCLEEKRMDLAKWLRDESKRLSVLHEARHVSLLAISREWNVQQDEIEALSMDLDLTQNFDTIPGIRQADRGAILAICDHLASSDRKAQLGKSTLPSLEAVSALLNYYQGQANKSSRKLQRYYEHIVVRLQQVWHQLEKSTF
jgi:hypothetical protein